MTSRDKYVSDYSWRTVVRNVILLGVINTYRVSVSPVDPGDPGALLPIQNNFLLVDNAGHIFVVISVGSGTVDVRDELLTGEHPVSGLTGIICKSANKGYSNLLPQGLLQYLDKSARSYLDSVAWSVLWQNDSNAIRIPITDTDTPAVENYQLDQVINGKTVNLQEDFGDNPGCDLYQQKTDEETGDGLEFKRSELASRVMVDGKISRIHFSGLGDIISGFILIYRQ